MRTRRYGLMRPGPATKAIALVLALGLVVGFAATYLVSAGVSMWIVGLAALLVLGVPLVAVARSGRR